MKHQIINKFNELLIINQHFLKMFLLHLAEAYFFEQKSSEKKKMN